VSAHFGAPLAAAGPAHRIRPWGAALADGTFNVVREPSAWPWLVKEAVSANGGRRIAWVVAIFDVAVLVSVIALAEAKSADVFVAMAVALAFVFVTTYGFDLAGHRYDITHVPAAQAGLIHSLDLIYEEREAGNVSDIDVHQAHFAAWSAHGTQESHDAAACINDMLNQNGVSA
jgi:hypothetical protein